MELEGILNNPFDLEILENLSNDKDLCDAFWFYHVEFFFINIKLFYDVMKFLCAKII